MSPVGNRAARAHGFVRSITPMARLRRVRSDERGVVLIIVAGMMVAVLAMAALAIDVGSFYQAQRQAQSAAAAAALAGADDLSTNPSGVTTDAMNLAKTNFPSSDGQIVTQPTTTSVKVDRKSTRL